MSSHLRDIDHRCGDCGRRATVELYNTFNEPIGKFCKRDGERRLKERLKNEPNSFAFTSGRQG